MSIVGTNDPDTLPGTGGNDTIYGRDGDDLLRGLAGDDILNGDNGNDQLFGGPGDDSLYGGVGNDFLYGDEDDDYLDGGLGDDQLFGGTGNDTLNAFAGNDVLLGGDGNDTLQAGQGQHTLDGGIGDDRLNISDGIHSASGGSGNDLIYGNFHGASEVHGGAGIDTLRWYVSAQTSGFAVNIDMSTGLLSGGAFSGGAISGVENISIGNSTSGIPTHNWSALTITGNDDANTIIVYDNTAGPLVILGNGGADTITTRVEGANIDGGAGDDSIVASLTGVVGSTLTGGAGNDTIRGSNQDDILDGGDDADEIFAGAGADTLTGGMGNDIIHGSDGEDSILGGEGNDSIFGGRGTDFIDGGVGNDVISTNASGTFDSTGSENETVRGGEGHDIISATNATNGDLRGGTGNDTISSNGIGAVLYGEEGHDHLTGYNNSELRNGVHTSVPGVKLLDGGAGNDTLIARGQDIEISGGADDDVIELHHSGLVGIGGSGNDRISAGGVQYEDLEYRGEDGNDTIIGNTNADKIFGGDGADSIDGGRGEDTVSGGDGNDTIQAHRENKEIDAGADDDLVHIEIPLTRFSSLNSDSRVNIDGGDGTDTINLQALASDSTVLVDFTSGRVHIANGPSNFNFSFDNVEVFTGSDNISYRGLNIDAPSVIKLSASSTEPSDNAWPSLVKPGSTLTFEDEMGPGDTSDFFQFTAKQAGRVSVSTWVGGHENEKANTTLTVTKGLNKFLVLQNGDVPQTYDYMVRIEMDEVPTPKKVISQTFLNDRFVGWTKTALLDTNKIGAELFVVIHETVDSADEAARLLGDAARSLGIIGDLIDISLAADTIQAAFREGGVEAGRRETFVVISDILAGMAATGAGGFAGSVVGPAGTLLGGVGGGFLYGLLLSDAIKEEAGDQYDVLNLNSTGPGLSQKSNLSSTSVEDIDISHLVFDQVWYASQHPEAVAAVQAGEWPSYMSYYLDIGLELGHAPNADSRAIQPAELALNLPGYDKGLHANTAILSEGSGDFHEGTRSYAGDSISVGELAVVEDVEDYRPLGIRLSAELSSIANRVARDWVLNQSETLQEAAFAGGVGDWVRTLSNGNSFGSQFARFGTEPGQAADFSPDKYARIFGYLGTETAPENILDELLKDPNFKATLDDTYASTGAHITNNYGIAEFGGLWIVVTYAFTIPTPAPARETAIELIKATASNNDDFFTAGLSRFSGTLLDGNDTFIGGQYSDTVEGGLGNDSLRGGASQDRLFGDAGSDTIKGEAGNDLLFGEEFNVGQAADISAQVYRMYQATLGRAPDIGGHEGWTFEILRGALNLNATASAFVRSLEFQNKYGGLNNENFVELLYQNVLGRGSDPGGKQGWLDFLAGGATRADVVTGFSESREFVSNTSEDAQAFATALTAAPWQDNVYRIYQATLGRAPDEGGFKAWVEQLGSGTDLQTVLAGFVGSREFQNTYGALDNGDFVELLYGNVLGRPSDPGGKQAWLDRLDGGATRESVVLGFSESREFIRNTSQPMANWIRQLGEDDILEGGTGNNKLAGGILSDRFVFDAGMLGTHQILDLEAWDRLHFRGFGYTSEAQARNHMNQVGDDVEFVDQDVRVTLDNILLGQITDDMILI
jgi:Ca2+-binding RTX toxin-like protein